jgi:hypothetical protein
MKERDVFEVLFQTTDLLRSLGLQHVVVGAFAFAALGGARGTMDVDFMVLAESQTLDQAREMAEKQGFKADWAWRRENPLLRDLQVRLIRRRIPVDIMLPRDRHDKATIKRRRRKKIRDRMIWAPTPEDFIVQKVKVGRPRDFEDALVILKYHERSIDGNYLGHWATVLGIKEEMSYLFSCLG